MSDLADRERTPISRSLASLERLYAVIVGLSLTNGVRHVGERVFGSQADTTSPKSMWTGLACLVVLVVTLFPFYNGVNRHLDLTYRFYPANRAPKAAWLTMDFILLFGPCLVFFAMSQTLFMPDLFLTFTFVLFGLDILWACLTKWVTLPSDNAIQQLNDWLVRNIFAAIGVGIVFLAIVLSWIGPGVASLLVAIGLTARTIHDYWKNAQHYFSIEVPTIAEERSIARDAADPAISTGKIVTND